VGFETGRLLAHLSADGALRTMHNMVLFQLKTTGLEKLVCAIFSYAINAQ
jgi:hypothetical protein